MSEAIGQDGAGNGPQIDAERRTGAPEGSRDGTGSGGAETVAWLEDMLDPRATIRQIGRWTYEVTTSLHELGTGRDYYVLGRRRAERLARRKLAELLADHARHEQVTTIRPEDL